MISDKIVMVFIHQQTNEQYRKNKYNNFKIFNNKVVFKNKINKEY